MEIIIILVICGLLFAGVCRRAATRAADEERVESRFAQYCGRR